MGVGLLYVRNGVDLEPVLHGGGQELGRRSGTHNVAGIVGMAAALDLARGERSAFRERVGACRDAFEDELAALIPDVVFTVPRRQRLVQHSHFRVPGLPAETMLIRLDAAGVAASAGSACHSGATSASPVLAAMGLAPDVAAACLRFSFGWTTRPGDGAAAARIVAGVVEDLR
jgi:cysteine desulfurase